VTFDSTGFTVEPLGHQAACTPMTVAAHMLYENRDPFRMREPAGTLDTSGAVYEALDGRRVRVEGSRFETATQYTNKLEGAAPLGYQTSILVGIRDPHVLEVIDEFRSLVLHYLTSGVEQVFGLTSDQFDLQLRAYGYDAVLEGKEKGTPWEVGMLFVATAGDQATATEIAKYANPVLLHAPLPGTTTMPSYAFSSSPAETERGLVHEFVLCHAVDVDCPEQLFRTVMDQVGS
jgi:hypothetical protein